MRWIIMVLLVSSDYKIVPKPETRVLIRTLEECKSIYNGWTVLSEDAQNELENYLNIEIIKKLDKCFKFYNRMYNIEIENGYGLMKNIEINISNICEGIISWED